MIREAVFDGQGRIVGIDSLEEEVPYPPACDGDHGGEKGNAGFVVVVDYAVCARKYEPHCERRETYKSLILI